MKGGEIRIFTARAVLPVAFFSLMLILVASHSTLVTATNWSEVARFTGSGTEQYTTDYFTCDHVEWRIRWEYVPDSDYPDLAKFIVYTFPQGECCSFIHSILETGGENTSGTSYIHNWKGTFYVKINVANTESYTIIVEQDLHSIPEFSGIGMVLAIFLIFTVVMITLTRKMWCEKETPKIAWTASFFLS